MPMIPALFLILSAVAYRIVTGLYGHSDSTWLLELRAVGRDRPLCCGLFPAQLQVHRAAARAFHFRPGSQPHYHASFFTPQILSHYLGFALVGCLGLLLQDRPR